MGMIQPSQVTRDRCKTPPFGRRRFLQGTLALGVAGGLRLPVVSAAEAVQRPAPGSRTERVALKINTVSGNLVNFGYRTWNGNQPNAYRNSAYLWSVSANKVPWNRPPQAAIEIAGNQPTGDQNFKNVQITDTAYLLGYAVGPKIAGSGWSPYANVIATALIPREGSGAPTYQYFSTDVAVVHAGTTSLAFDFHFPPGFFAKQAGAWAGLWSGAGASPVLVPRWHAPIEIDSNAGTSGLNDIQLDRGMTYTLAIFPTGAGAGLDLKRLAAAVTFTA